MEEDNPAINESRGLACEIVAWRFLTHLSEHDLIEYLLHELSESHQGPGVSLDIEASGSNGASSDSSRFLHTDETSPLLCERRLTPQRVSRGHSPRSPKESQSPVDGRLALRENDFSAAFVGLNALEVAAVANAKKFLSQPVVQKVVNSIWSGDIVFWDSLNIYTKKKAQLYNQR